MSNYTVSSEDEESIVERLLRLQVIAFSTQEQLDEIVLTALKANKGIGQILKDIEKLLEENSK